MLLLIDRHAAQQLVRCDQVSVDGEMRYYYHHASPGCFFHLVSRAGIIEHLAGQTVDAAIGWSEGWHNKCHPDHEGLQLTKVTIYRQEDGIRTTTLSSIIAQSNNRQPRRPPSGASWTQRWGEES